MEYLSRFWVFLGENHREIAALSSIIFGISSAALAVFAYLLNRTNSYGSRPMVILSTLGGDKPKSSSVELATFDCSVWNRHKYPIQLHMISVSYKDIDTSGINANAFFEDWYCDSKVTFLKLWKEELGAGLRMDFSRKFPVKSDGVYFATPSVRVVYFDYMRGAYRTAKVHRRDQFRWRRRRLRLAFAKSIRPLRS